MATKTVPFRSPFESYKHAVFETYEKLVTLNKLPTETVELLSVTEKKITNIGSVNVIGLLAISDFLKNILVRSDANVSDIFDHADDKLCLKLEFPPHIVRVIYAIASGKRADLRHQQLLDLAAMFDYLMIPVAIFRDIISGMFSGKQSVGCNHCGLMSNNPAALNSLELFARLNLHMVNRGKNPYTEIIHRLCDKFLSESYFYPESCVCPESKHAFSMRNIPLAVFADPTHKSIGTFVKNIDIHPEDWPSDFCIALKKLTKAAVSHKLSEEHCNNVLFTMYGDRSFINVGLNSDVVNAVLNYEMTTGFTFYQRYREELFLRSSMMSESDRNYATDHPRLKHMYSLRIKQYDCKEMYSTDRLNEKFTVTVQFSRSRKLPEQIARLTLEHTNEEFFSKHRVKIWYTLETDPSEQKTWIFHARLKRSAKNGTMKTLLSNPILGTREDLRDSVIHIKKIVVTDNI